jgi:Ca2+-binding RTX toxin-like protein
LVTITVAPTVVQDDVFYVAGTTGADRILIQPASGGRINVRYNNALFGPFSDAQRVVVIGFAGNDNITVSGSLPYPVAFYGGDGNDYLSGGSRADILDGGEGTDRLFGNGGNDELYGGPGNDTLSGGAGDDLLDGDSTTDLIADVTSQDLASLIGAVDLPDASLHGRDNLSGVAGNDILYGQGGGDVLNGGAGNDQMYAGEGSDKLDGGSGNDLLAGEAGADKLYGRAGRDTLVGGDDLDTIYGGTGMDLIYGGDVDLATLFTIWENWSTGVSADADQAFADLDGSANDDGLVDLLHGEGDADWYLNYSDRFLLSSEARLPNRIENR